MLPRMYCLVQCSTVVVVAVGVGQKVSARDGYKGWSKCRQQYVYYFQPLYSCVGLPVKTTIFTHFEWFHRFINIIRRRVDQYTVRLHLGFLT